MSNKHAIEMPEVYLIILAAHGNMGDGEIPTSMKFWAQGEVRRLGLDDKLRKTQEDYTKQLMAQLKNTLGDDGIKALGASFKKLAEEGGGQQ
jgi:hypothetical protein